MKFATDTTTERTTMSDNVHSIYIVRDARPEDGPGGPLRAEVLATVIGAGSGREAAEAFAEFEGLSDVQHPGSSRTSHHAFTSEGRVICFRSRKEDQIQTTETTTEIVPASKLRQGDLVMLEGDRFAEVLRAEVAEYQTMGFRAILEISAKDGSRTVTDLMPDLMLTRKAVV